MRLILQKSKDPDRNFKKRLVLQYSSKGIEWNLDVLGWLFIHTLGFIPHWTQYFLWKVGYSWHDPLNNVPTPRLGCYLHLIPKEMEGIFQQLRDGQPIIKAPVKNHADF